MEIQEEHYYTFKMSRDEEVGMCSLTGATSPGERETKFGMTKDVSCSLARLYQAVAAAEGD